LNFDATYSIDGIEGQFVLIILNQLAIMLIELIGADVKIVPSLVLLPVCPV
jgi:hypothetical protein